jgi:mannitol/fructose-specific phosphotransferase system IIA component (Ntr-type)
MKISSLLDQQTILLNLKVDSKETLIKKMVSVLSGKVDDSLLPIIEEAVLEREQVMSTGVGKRLGIPHAKLPQLDQNLAVFARLDSPLEYGSIDNQPVELVVLLIGSQDKASVHIKLLSRVSRLMNNDLLRNQLFDAKNEDQILEIFTEEESGAF